MLIMMFCVAIVFLSVNAGVCFHKNLILCGSQFCVIGGKMGRDILLFSVLSDSGQSIPYFKTKRYSRSQII